MMATRMYKLSKDEVIEAFCDYLVKLYPELSDKEGKVKVSIKTKDHSAEVTFYETN